MMNPNYEKKTVKEWMDEMAKGELALTDFQRSRVWDDMRTARFLKAVLRGETTGTILLVESGPEFGSRGIQDNEANIENAENLILDGQQRLTSLWQGLMGVGNRCFYIKVKDLQNKDIQILDVIHRQEGFRKYSSPQSQFSDNVIPVSILYDSPLNHNSKTRVDEWCEKVIPGDSSSAGDLRRFIEKKLKIPLEEYKIWFAKFEGIGVDKAASIFVQTNSSSVIVKAFDLAVAQALEIRPDIKLRERIQRFYENHDRVKYYFHKDKERWIPEIGDCLLKIACLKAKENGLPPKDKNFGDALDYLFGTGTENADTVESNLDTTLRFLEDNGVPIKGMLPRMPPVYVIAALQDEFDSIRPINKSEARKLRTKYLWWSFFSDHYKNQANDRLYEDFKNLRENLRHIKQGKEIKRIARIFRNIRVMIKEKDLYNQNDPIGRSSPIGKAIMALTIYSQSQDWVTEEPLTVSQVRQLEEERRLDRHHVFPRKVLTGIKKELINHGLNTVLIEKPTNIILGGKEPALYLDDLKKKNARLTDEQLKKCIESHFVPYDELVEDNGTVKDRYEEYLRARANVIWKEIKARTE